METANFKKIREIRFIVFREFPAAWTFLNCLSFDKSRFWNFNCLHFVMINNILFFTGVTTTNGSSALIAKGPDEDKIKEILNRTGYKLDVTTGQRKYGGPPPNWEGDPPASGCEVSIQQIFREIN